MTGIPRSRRTPPSLKKPVNAVVLIVGAALDESPANRKRKLKRASQPYRDIERFLADEKVMEYIIGPGLLPVVMALSKDSFGKKLLVTRRLAGSDDDKGVVGHLDGFGVRIMMYFDKAAGETIVEWSCLYRAL